MDQNLEKKNHYNFLYPYYSSLLTQKQCEVFENYYFEDYSLSEISEAFGVSRNAIWDLLKKVEHNLDEYEGGSHNGNNYFVYTFYIENLGSQTEDYWTELVIDDVIKNVDDAVRIRVYRDGQEITYAKMSTNGIAEPNTVPFESDDLIVREHVINFAPGAISKYTIVLWIEGSDPECTDNILGGEFKVQMNFNSEHVE